MKVKNLILSVVAFSVLLFSCTQEEIVPLTPNSTTQETMELATMAVNTPSSTTPKAYIFIEPLAKFLIVRNYLRDSTQKSPLCPLPFLGYNGVGGLMAIKYNFLNYVDMPHWYDGRLPAIIKADIPQVSGGLDSEGNPKIAYNFTTIKIPKNTVVGSAWINILIPVSAMNNDTKRQRKVVSYEKIGNALVKNGDWTGPTMLMDNVIYEYTFNYQGNKIPKGIYRVYGTYPSTGLNVNLTSNKDYFLRGVSNQ
jgi:hypothetical protein